jgi:hypothetical protein
MLRPGADEQNVQMSDVLCDFCQREWTEDVPFIEGHRGRIICGNCVRLAVEEVRVTGRGTAPQGYMCTLCRENEDDRAALDRAGEAGWSSPAYPESIACARCIGAAAEALTDDPDVDWPAG